MEKERYRQALLHFFPIRVKDFKVPFLNSLSQIHLSINIIFQGVLLIFTAPKLYEEKSVSSDFNPLLLLVMP